MKKRNCILIGLLILIGIATLSMMLKNENNVAIATSATVSNKKIGWGIKRVSNHKQPDLGAQNKRLIEESSGMAMGNAEEKFVYLTFDEGYEAGYTAELLNTLKENNVKATVFITAHYLNTQEELVKRMIDDGHIVGNHTVNHYSMPDITDEKIKDEIMKLHSALYEKTGYEMKYLR